MPKTVDIVEYALSVCVLVQGTLSLGRQVNFCPFILQWRRGRDPWMCSSDPYTSEKIENLEKKLCSQGYDCLTEPELFSENKYNFKGRFLRGQGNNTISSLL